MAIIQAAFAILLKHHRMDQNKSQDRAGLLLQGSVDHAEFA